MTELYERLHDDMIPDIFRLLKKYGINLKGQYFKEDLAECSDGTVEPWPDSKDKKTLFYEDLKKLIKEFV